MKSTITITIVMFSLLNIYSQEDPIVEVMIDFSQIDSALIIDTNQINNIWEIGAPQKPIFDSAYSSPNAICTSLDNNYTADNLSSFYLTIISDVFGSGLLEFVHKYDTDPENAGGYIEISYDKGKTWTNVVYDKNWKENFYEITDTICGNIPAFRGNSHEWENCSVYFLWYALVKKTDRFPPGWGLGNNENPDTLMLRFNFLSNEKAIEKEGWLLDNLKFQIWDLAGSTNEKTLQNYTMFYQPEFRTIKIICGSTYGSKDMVSIYDVHGRQNLRVPVSPGMVNVASLNNGIYIICIYSNGRLVHSEKILIY